MNTTQETCKTITERVGRALKLCRVRFGDLTIMETIDKLEPVYGRVSRSTISAWENGTRPITIAVLHAYAQAFGTTIVDLINDANRTPASVRANEASP